ncbi:MAG: D-alanyl-D-alanine carboxypeptidase [Oscillospiraceae bacterium]|nr:D-alanyl-D-alanine carboxypeptidase [Oscillospiraceae bacterium]
MKKISAILLIVCIILCITLPVSATQTQDNSIQAGCNTLDGMVTFLGKSQLINNAESVLLYEVTTDTLMYDYQPDLQVYPASLVKILTALIAIEKGTMTDAVTVREDVLNTVPDDAMGVDLVVDEVLSVEDLLACMLVGSANDAAAVLADHIMGSQQAFVDEMNRYAQQLGCVNTQFTNVHGLHNDQQYTTARDVCRFFTHALSNETFREMFGTVEYTVPATNKSESRKLSSGNYLINRNNTDNVEIYYDSRVTGSRTGITTDGKRCIASVAESNGLTLISIVLGSRSFYRDDGYSVSSFGGYKETTDLLDLGFTGFKTAQIFVEGGALQQLAVQNGQEDVVIGTHVSAASVLPEDADGNTLIYRYGEIGNLSAPIKKGEKISYVEVWSGTVCVARADLFALNSVRVSQPLEVDEPNGTLMPKIGNTLLIILGILFCVIILAFVILCIIRGARIASIKKRSRRHSRNRRRSW